MRWGLDADSWMAWIRADLLRRTLSGEPTAVDGEASSEDDDVGAAVFAEALCSGALDGFVRRLAGHAAVFEEARRRAAREEADPDAASEAAGLPETFSRRILEERAPRPLPGDHSREGGRRRTDLSGPSTTSSDRSSRPPPSTRACAPDRSTGRGSPARTLLLPREEMAREALLSLRDDGLSLDEVARDAKAAVEDRRVFVDELPAGIRDRLLAARKGELLGPLPWDDGFARRPRPREDAPVRLRRTVARRGARISWRPSSPARSTRR